MTVCPPSSNSGTRRRILLKGVACLPFAFASTRSLAVRAAEERVLAFHHTHTDERLEVVFSAGGAYRPDALRAINALLRDFRTGDLHPIDPRLLEILHALCSRCGGGVFEIISGYRSPRTNATLRSASGGVAEHSLHLEGRAIDVRLRGSRTARLRDAAISLAQGGVGYYPRSDFVHLDTGRVREWGPREA
jgi:uncharacterized protein YcbK (DUF882 family)